MANLRAILVQGVIVVRYVRKGSGWMRSPLGKRVGRKALWVRVPLLPPKISQPLMQSRSKSHQRLAIAQVGEFRGNFLKEL